MKTFAKIFTILFLVVLLSGCTVHLKATDFEASGGVSGIYQIDSFSFTERGDLWR